LHQIGLERIGGPRHDDRDRARCRPRGIGGYAAIGHDEVDAAINERGGERWHTVWRFVGALMNQNDVAPFDKALFGEGAPERIELALRRRRRPQQADAPYLRLLRARHERPHDRRAAEQRDELAAP
jgi:hypothetical protein